MSPVTSFLVTYTGGGGGTHTLAAGTYTYTFAGLTAGTAYTFSVEAINAVGTGPASASVVVTPTNANFSPPDVSGLTVWLKGSTSTGSNGAAESSWADSSATGTTSRRPRRPTSPRSRSRRSTACPRRHSTARPTSSRAAISPSAALSLFIVFERTGTASNYTRIIEGGGGDFSVTANGPTAANEAGDGTGLLFEVGSAAQLDAGTARSHSTRRISPPWS